MNIFIRTPDFHSAQRAQRALLTKPRPAFPVPLARPQRSEPGSARCAPRTLLTKAFWHSGSVSDEHVAMQACYEDHLNRVKMASVFACLRGDEPTSF